MRSKLETLVFALDNLAPIIEAYGFEMQSRRPLVGALHDTHGVLLLHTGESCYHVEDVGQVISEEVLYASA